MHLGDRYLHSFNVQELVQRILFVDFTLISNVVYTRITQFINNCGFNNPYNNLFYYIKHFRLRRLAVFAEIYELDTS
jgi:hypothetical protein